MDELLEFEIPTHYSSAIINADTSGLNDEDEKELDEFIDDVVETYGNANFMLGEKSDESYFATSNDINNLGGDVTILYLQPTKEYSFGGGVAVGGIVGAYLGYKVGRMRPQKAGFETEKKIGRRIKKEGKKIAGDMTISKKKPQTMAKGGGLKEEDNSEENLRQELRSGKITQNQFNLRTKARELNTPTYSHLYEIRDREKDGFNEVWGRFKDRTRKDFGGDKYAKGGKVNSKEVEDVIKQDGSKFKTKKEFIKEVENVLEDLTDEKYNQKVNGKWKYNKAQIALYTEVKKRLLSDNYAKGGLVVGDSVVVNDSSSEKELIGKKLIISNIYEDRDGETMYELEYTKLEDHIKDVDRGFYRDEIGLSYAEGGRVYEHLDKADSHLREAGSKLWQNKNPKSDEYKKAYDDFQDELMGIYTPREWNELDYAGGGEIDKAYLNASKKDELFIRVVKNDNVKEYPIETKTIKGIENQVNKFYEDKDVQDVSMVRYFNKSKEGGIDDVTQFNQGGNISYDLSDVI